MQLITNSALATAKAEFTILFRAVRLKYPNRKKLLEATRPERAEALSPGQRPGLRASALSGRIGNFNHTGRIVSLCRRIAIRRAQLCHK